MKEKVYDNEINHSSMFMYCLSVDATTARNLELVHNMKDIKSDHTLFGVLNYTKTSGGGKLCQRIVFRVSFLFTFESYIYSLQGSNTSGINI